MAYSRLNQEGQNSLSREHGGEDSARRGWKGREGPSREGPCGTGKVPVRFCFDNCILKDEWVFAKSAG